MESKEQLARLETIAKEMRVRVSYEPMAGLVQGIGGLCRVQGEWRIIVDRRMQAPERVQVVADALARFEGPTRAAIDEVMAAPAA